MSTSPTTSREKTSSLGLGTTIVAVFSSLQLFALFLSPWTAVQPALQMYSEFHATLPALTRLFLANSYLPLLAAMPLLGMLVVGLTGPAQLHLTTRRRLIFSSFLLAIALAALMMFAITCPLFLLGSNTM